MSGGSYNYIYNKLSEECEDSMYDAEMNDLIKDLCKVLHDLEWWQSCDTSEEQYRDEVSRFKKKWLNKDSVMLDKIRAEIKAKIEEEEFARSVFRHEEKDTTKAEQCTGSIMAYNNVIKLIDKYKAESEDKE